MKIDGNRPQRRRPSVDFSKKKVRFFTRNSKKTTLPIVPKFVLGVSPCLEVPWKIVQMYHNVRFHVQICDTEKKRSQKCRFLDPPFEILRYAKSVVSLNFAKLSIRCAKMRNEMNA